MVDVTLLEVNLEGAEITANAPFSGGDGKSIKGSKLSKVLGRSSSKSSGSKSSRSKSSSKIPSIGSSTSDDESTDESAEEPTDPVELDIEDADADDSSSSPVGPMLAFAALVVLALAVRKLRSKAAGNQHQIDDFE